MNKGAIPVKSAVPGRREREAEFRPEPAVQIGGPDATRAFIWASPHASNKPSMANTWLTRAGRAARAGRSGTAVSLIEPDEIPYLLDLALYLGRKGKPVRPRPRLRSLAF